MEQYATALSWVFGILSLIWIILALLASWSYSELDRLRDRMQGLEQTFPIIKPVIISIICWTWILIH